MECKKCKSELEYVGEHWDDDEGYCSAYICKKCYPIRYRELRNSWLSHLRKCKKERFACHRCNGEGLKYQKSKLIHH